MAQAGHAAACVHNRGWGSAAGGCPPAADVPGYSAGAAAGGGAAGGRGGPGVGVTAGDTAGM
jgi:hypothetical protein